MLSKLTVTFTALAAVTNAGAGGGNGPLVNGGMFNTQEGCGRSGEGGVNFQISMQGNNEKNDNSQTSGDYRGGDHYTGGSRTMNINEGDIVGQGGDSSDQSMYINREGAQVYEGSSSSSKSETNTETTDNSIDCSNTGQPRSPHMMPAPGPPVQWGGYNAPGAMGGYGGGNPYMRGGMQGGGGYGNPNYGYNPQQYGSYPQQGGYPQGQPMGQSYNPQQYGGNPQQGGYQQGYPQGQPMNSYDQTGRRLEKGQTVDFVCVRVMELVRRLPIDMLSAIVSEPTESNKVAVNKAAQRLVDECQYDTEWSWSMNQCVFYVKAALAMDYEELEESWLASYGDLGEQMRGCGRVVTAVNADFHRRIEAGEVQVMQTKAIVGHEEEDKIETHYDSFYLVEKSEDSITRRLAQAVGLASVATGTLLGHICRNFNPATGDIVPLVNV